MAAPKILIVEDDAVVAKHTEVSLVRMGYDVVSVQTCSEQAVTAAAELAPHLILMDITIQGGVDGIETATIIRSRMDIPIIFLTAASDNGTLQRAKSTEPYAFIIKPFDENELRAAIEVALYKHKMQRQLREHEQWLGTVMNCIGDAVVGTDDQGRIRLFNAAAERLAGCTASGAVGRLVGEIVRLRTAAHEPYHPVVPHNAPRELRPLPEGMELCTQAGEWIPVEGTVSTIGDAGNGTDGGIVVALRDISIRRRAEEQLQHSEERYRSILQQSADCIFLVDTDTLRVVEANAALHDLLGYSSEEVRGVSLYDIVAHDRESVDANLQKIRTQGMSLIGERMYRRKDGSLVSVDVTVNLVSYSGKNQFCIVARDITERKRFEQTLKESELRFRSIYEYSPVMMQSIDEQGCIRNVNQKWLQVMGYARNEVIGRSVLDFMTPDSAERASTIVLPQFWEQGFVSDVGYRFVRRDGTEIDVLLNCNVAADPTHRRISLTVLQDITEQKRAEEALLRSQRKYSELIRNVPIAIMRFLLQENKYEFVNNAFEEQSGYTLEEVETLTDGQLVDMIHEHDRYRVFNAFRLWQENGYRDLQHIIYRIINKQGKVVWLDSYMYADFDEHGRAVALNQICVDISGLKKAEAALSDTLREDFRRTVQNLQNLVIKLYLLPDGNYAYSLREGKLAGELTTSVVRGKTPYQIYGNSHDALVRPYVMRAFAGESISFELELDDKWFFYSLEPVIENGRVEEVVGSAVDITSQKNTERLLRDSEQKFRVLVENLPIAIVQSELRADGSLHLQYVNPQYERQTGYSTDECLEMGEVQRLDLYHTDDRESLMQAWERWKQPESTGALHHLFRFRHSTGEYRWFDNHAIKYPTHSGFSVIEAVLDVTEQKINEEHLRRLASFPEQDPNPIIELDLHGHIRYVNPTARNVFADILTKHLSHPVVAWVWENIGTLLRQPGRVLSREVELDGEVYEQAVLYLPEVELVRIFCYVVTERKRAEEQLRKALAKERELSNLKTRFVTTVSHEFRTPLTGILMSAEVLERYSARMSEEEREVEVDKIKKRVHELTDLMNDFLLQSSAESMSDTFRPVLVDLAALCGEVVNDQKSLASSQQVPLHYSVGKKIPPVQGDPKLLRLVLQNLISNAVKFTPDGKAVHVNLGCSDGAVVFSVRDEGIGIPQDEIDHLFTPFYRASNAAKIPGTGIGLSIVREFVELHNGSISVHSRDGEGSTFTVVMPAADPDEREE